MLPPEGHSFPAAPESTRGSEPGDLDGGRPRRRRVLRTFGVVLATIVAVLVTQVVVATQIQVPWVAFEPGAATSTFSRLSVDGADVEDPEGEILFLTVRTNRLDALEWLQRARNPHVDIVREEHVYGDRSPEETRQFNRLLMQRSKSNAELVALDYLGYDVYDATGVAVVNVEEGTPADGVLEPGMVITAVDGTATTTAPELVDLLAGRAPGDSVTLRVEDGDGANVREIALTLAERPDGEPGGFVGVGIETRLVERDDLPVELEIDSGDIGGDSAGLAFALAIIDSLTPESLTGDRVVAATGSIDIDGSVGAVGGVAQKVVTARRAGAGHILVPDEQVEVARDADQEINVIPVSNLQEALDALEALGGSGGEVALGGDGAD